MAKFSIGVVTVSLITSINYCLLNIPESRLMPTFCKYQRALNARHTEFSRSLVRNTRVIDSKTFIPKVHNGYVWQIHQDPWTKWSPFRRRYFHLHFCQWKVLYFDYNFTAVCSSGSKWQWPSTGLDNGLASNRRQAIIWTNADAIHWHIHAALGK